MTQAEYRNFGHYIGEGWAREPKEIFKALDGHLVAARGAPLSGRLLDVGCATGELIGFLRGRHPDLSCTGVDIFPALLDEARHLVRSAEFVEASALSLPERFRAAFDIVLGQGVMSIFDESELETFWRQLVSVARPGGTIVVCAPLNEYGVDVVIRHRKRMDGKLGAWERGWNVFARETVEEILAALGCPARFEPFRLGRRLEPRHDPVRTWTLATERNPMQLTNGLKLLVDHSFIIVGVPGEKG